MGTISFPASANVLLCSRSAHSLSTARQQVPGAVHLYLRLLLSSLSKYAALLTVITLILNGKTASTSAGLRLNSHVLLISLKHSAASLTVSVITHNPPDSILHGPRPRSAALASPSFSAIALLSSLSVYLFSIARQQVPTVESEVCCSARSPDAVSWDMSSASVSQSCCFPQRQPLEIYRWIWR